MIAPLTAVVLTPYLLLSGSGAGAEGVSMNSNDSSEYVEAALRSEDMFVQGNGEKKGQVSSRLVVAVEFRATATPRVFAWQGTRFGVAQTLL